MVALPFEIDRVPLGLGQLVDVGRDTIMLPSADKVLGEIALSEVPVSPQLAERFDGVVVRRIRCRLDGEIGMSQFVGPLIIGVRQEEWSRSFTRRGAHRAGAWTIVERSH